MQHYFARGMVMALTLAVGALVVYTVRLNQEVVYQRQIIERIVGHEKDQNANIKSLIELLEGEE